MSTTGFDPTDVTPPEPSRKATRKPVAKVKDNVRPKMPPPPPPPSAPTPSIELNGRVTDKIALFQTIYIEHPRMAAAHSWFDYLRQLGRKTKGKPQEAIRMLGPSGSGKTTAVTSYQQRQPDSNDKKPILHVPLQHAATPRRLWSDMLTALQDDFAITGSEEVLKKRAQRYLDLAEVEIIIIDEVQQLVSKEGARTAWNVTEALKRLLDTGIAPVVLMGTYEATPIFKANPQLTMRLHKILILYRSNHLTQPISLCSRATARGSTSAWRASASSLPVRAWLEATSSDACSKYPEVCWASSPNWCGFPSNARCETDEMPSTAPTCQPRPISGQSREAFAIRTPSS